MTAILGPAGAASAPQTSLPLVPSTSTVQVSRDSRRCDSRRRMVAVGAVVAWIPAVLLADRSAGLTGQLALGAVTWVMLAALLWRRDAAVRTQVLIVVAFASLVEFTCAPGLGIYTYRLGSVPAFVPPGHGLVYLAALSVGRSRRLARHTRALTWLTVAATGCYAVWGMLLSARPDLLGMLWFGCLLVFMRVTRQPLVYVGAVLIVTYLELLGTGLGSWSWSLRDPTGLITMGNPPSVAAGGYGFFDAAAIGFAPRLLILGAVTRAAILRGRRRRQTPIAEPA